MGIGLITLLSHCIGIMPLSKQEWNNSNNTLNNLGDFNTSLEISSMPVAFFTLHLSVTFFTSWIEICAFKNILQLITLAFIPFPIISFKLVISFKKTSLNELGCCNQKTNLQSPFPHFSNIPLKQSYIHHSLVLPQYSTDFLGLNILISLQNCWGLWVCK